jgi:hypothetical protein
VFRVAISTVDDKTKLQLENLKMPEPLATRLSGDVKRWATGEEGCGEGPITAGWATKEGPAAKPGAKPTGKAAGK